jgi:hypothetical protein
MTRSGRIDRMRSVSGSSSAPTFGSFTASGGYLSKLLTAISRSPAPIAKIISVVAGISEMMRLGTLSAAAARATAELVKTTSSCAIRFTI